MIVRPIIAAALLVAPATAQAQGAGIARIVRTFGDVCLAHAASLPDIRRAATAAPFSFAVTQSLPGLGGGGKIEGYRTADGIELALRTDKKGFGCIVLSPLTDDASDDAVAAAVSALPGLTVKSPGKGKVYRAAWLASAAPKGSDVSLTIYGDATPRSLILTLDSKGSPS